jgi:hypothetical protein
MRALRGEGSLYAFPVQVIFGLGGAEQIDSEFRAAHAIKGRLLG